MGAPSFLRFIPKSSAAVPIDWSIAPEKSKQYFQDNYNFYVEPEPEITDEEDTAKEDTASEEVTAIREERPLPQTIGGLAACFHEKKFFGYMKPELCQFLLDVSEFGLKHEKSNEHGLSVGPLFYMKYGWELWFLLFTPRDNEGVSSGCTKFPQHFEDDWDDAAEAGKDKKFLTRS